MSVLKSLFAYAGRHKYLTIPLTAFFFYQCGISADAVSVDLESSGRNFKSVS